MSVPAIRFAWAKHAQLTSITAASVIQLILMALSCANPFWVILSQ